VHPAAASWAQARAPAEGGKGLATVPRRGALCSGPEESPLSMSLFRHRASLALALGLALATSPLRPAWGASDYERYLRAAERLYESLEYERALQQLSRARKLASSVQQDVEVSLYEGILYAELGRWAQARVSFKAALLLEPEAKLPITVSPKVQKELEAQREQVRKELAGRKPSGPVSSAPPPQEPPAEPLRPSTDKPLRPDLKPAPRGEPAAPVATVQQPARAVPVVPVVLLGVGVAAAGAGSAFGLMSQGQVQAARAATFQSETVEHLRQAQGSATTANVLFLSAGAAAVGAVVTWLLAPPSPPPPAPRRP
jgi:tetratricopeptide (TPR) repeat protein